METFEQSNVRVSSTWDPRGEILTLDKDKSRIKMIECFVNNDWPDIIVMLLKLIIVHKEKNLLMILFIIRGDQSEGGRTEAAEWLPYEAV